jgi:hypothetical protein
MRKNIVLLAGVVAIAALLLTSLPASAELQNVQVGGETRIRYNWIRNNYPTPTGLEIRWPSAWLPGRSVGDALSHIGSGGNPLATRNNGLGAVGFYSWDKNTNDLTFVEQRTRLHVSADFTDDVSAFIELDSYDWWGEDFRSNYITGADARANSVNDIEVFQAYIEAADMFGTPLRLRIGRQELSFGNEFLVGNKDFGPNFVGLSFDAIRATYAADVWSVDAWAATLFESGVAEQDGDVWFYGLYGSCSALENVTFDVYYLLLRDARRINDTNGLWFSEWIEDVLDLDDYDVTNIHTVGFRSAGAMAGFDFNLEVAYQWGDVGQIGTIFKPFVYGDNRAELDQWGGSIEVGYTFDAPWQPRVALGFDYYGGEDERDISFMEWLWPFNRPKSSANFNRLFSDKMFNGFLDLNNDMSNVWSGHIVAMAHPTEQVTVIADVYYFEALGTWKSPVYWDLGGFRVPLAPVFSFWTQTSSPELAWSADLVVLYQYSEDLSFSAHYSHLFPLDGLDQGNFTAWNGLVTNQGSAKDDSTYLTFETRLKF